MSLSTTVTRACSWLGIDDGLLEQQFASLELLLQHVESRLGNLQPQGAWHWPASSLLLDTKVEPTQGIAFFAAFADDFGKLAVCGRADIDDGIRVNDPF
ncbi:MAG: hypothetical protein ACI835_004129 [Planctomycetota bacterium]|jgi:hypothetical protein